MDALVQRQGLGGGGSMYYESGPPPDKPPRGPSNHSNGGHGYADNVDVSLEREKGREREITCLLLT